MAAKKAAPVAEQIPASRPTRVEIRINGSVRFADTCYDVALDKDAETGAVTFSAATKPRMIDAPPPRASQRSEFQNDPRNGEEQIWQVHSGRRT